MRNVWTYPNRVYINLIPLNWNLGGFVDLLHGDGDLRPDTVARDQRDLAHSSAVPCSARFRARHLQRMPGCTFLHCCLLN